MVAKPETAVVLVLAAHSSAFALSLLRLLRPQYFLAPMLDRCLVSCRGQREIPRSLFFLSPFSGRRKVFAFPFFVFKYSFLFTNSIYFKLM
jgi:hypothetical protein